MKIKIRLAQTDDAHTLIRLVAEFRQALAQLRGTLREIDLESASSELTTYQERDFPIYVAEDGGGRLVGYLVCRVDDGVVWAESLYVSPSHRRQGIAAALYVEAERLADELGNDTLYNWVDPNNTRIISFLQKRGYNVLNLIELRRPRPGEELTDKINVGATQFDTH